MAWVYILKSNRDDRFYIGSTNDLERRIEQHNRNHTPTTHRMGSTQLVFSQKYQTLKEARTVERKLKQLKRRDYIQKIIDQRLGFVGYFGWSAVAERRYTDWWGLYERIRTDFAGGG